MRQIGSIASQPDAERFSDYLLAAGMPNMVEEGAGGWAVWVENDDHLDRARVELDAFTADPSNGKYASASQTAKKVRSAEQKKQEKRRTRYVDVRTSWGQPARYARPV